MPDAATVSTSVKFTEERFTIGEMHADYAEAKVVIEGSGTIKGTGEFSFKAENIRPERIMPDRQLSGLVGLSRSTEMVGAAGFSALIGGGLISFMATSQSVVQLSATDDVRGRVLGIWSMVISGGLPVGGLIAGDAADAWGEPVVIGYQGVICGTMALALFGARWALRKRTSKEEL